MRITSFVIGFVTGLVFLAIGGLTVARERFVSDATSWIPSFLSGDSTSLVPWWFVVATGALLVVAASTAFERPLFAMAGYGLGAVSALVATFAGAPQTWIAVIPAGLAAVALLVPPKDWPERG